MKKIPVTAIIVVAIVVIFAGIIFYLSNNRAPTSYEKMSSRELATLCLPMEGQVMHIHSHLTIIIAKQAITLPAEIGVSSLKGCMNSLHTHDASGIIHVESPAQKDYTIGDFFAVWGMALSKDQVLTNKVDAEHALKFYVDGKESMEFENLVILSLIEN